MSAKLAQSQGGTDSHKAERDEFYKAVVAAGKGSTEHKAHDQQHTGVEGQFMPFQTEVKGGTENAEAAKNRKTKMKTCKKYAVADQPAA